LAANVEESTMAARRTPLYIGTNRHVAALDPHTGDELWRTKLPHGGGSVVTLVIKGQHLFVGHAGHAYCLDKRSGQILWENGLPGMGYHPVLLAMEGAMGTSPDSAASAYRVEQQRRAAAAAAGGAAAGA
jgi:hypothetical protein